MINKNFDILVFLKTRPLSWSSMSSFAYDPEDWYRKYILGIKSPDTAELKFGREFAHDIEHERCKVPGLLRLLQKKKEHPFNVMFGKIPMTGFADAFCTETLRKLDELKTGAKAWDQKRANEHGQIKMYALMNLITNKVKPEDTTFRLYWVPTIKLGNFSVTYAQPIRFVPFEIKITMADVIKFGALINTTVKQMEAYVRNHA